MKIAKLEYPTELSKIENIDCDNIDVFVELEDGMTCTLTVGTPASYEEYMLRNEVNFIAGGCPDITVRQLTHVYIKEAIEDFCEGDGYWVKLYGFAGIRQYFPPIEELNTRYRIKSKDKLIELSKKENSIRSYKIVNVDCDNMDVFIELEDGITCTLRVVKPSYYEDYMQRNGVNFIPHACPDIIVKEMQHEYIKVALEEMCDSDSAYWIKLYGLLRMKDYFPFVEYLNAKYRIEKLSDKIAEKCAYGDHIDTLSKEEKVFYFVNAFELEVSSGGFGSFFVHSSGDYTSETLEALHSMGADKIVHLLSKAMKKFENGIVPSVFEERQNITKKLKRNKAWENLDKEFYGDKEYSAELFEIQYNYVMENNHKLSGELGIKYDENIQIVMSKDKDNNCFKG